MSPFLKKSKKFRKSKSKKSVNHHLYNNKRWVDLREQKRMNNPVCELCEMKGRTHIVEEVHHIIPISSGITEEEKELLAYDYDNLLSVCKSHHDELHKLLKKSPEGYYYLMKKFKNR